MKRKQFQQADAIITSDWHLRDKQPIARKDDFINQTQWEKVDFVAKLQQKHNCPVLHAGDLFDHWKPSPWLLNKTIQHLPDQFFTIYGNHDLPQHNLENHEQCGIDVLIAAGKINRPASLPIETCHWGMEPKNEGGILMWHTMTWDEERPYPESKDSPAWQLMEKYNSYDLIITGHNHKRFVLEEDGRLMINPGGISRQKADQMDDEPCVYLYFKDTNTVQRIIIPHDKDVLSREHIERKEKKDERIEAFVNTLDEDFKTEISFEQNLEYFFQVNEVRKPIKQIIYNSLEQ